MMVNKTSFRLHGANVLEGETDNKQVNTISEGGNCDEEKGDMGTVIG